MSSIKDLRKRLAQAELGGGAERLERQKKAGKLTARERIDLLLDHGSFAEIDQLVLNRKEKNPIYGDGVITGTGKINGRNVCIFSQDFTVAGGSLASAHAKKIIKLMDLAANIGCPLIGLNDSGGARIQEGVESLAGYADIFHRNVRYSGQVPQISLILGPCAGGAVYSPALTDFIFVVDSISHMFVTGPEVLRTVTREEVSKEALGGAKVHSEKSGVANFYAENEQAAFTKVKSLLSYLPDNCFSACQQSEYKGTEQDITALNDVVPANRNQAYNMKEIIQLLADNNEFLEVHADYAKNIVIGFIKLNGASVGVVANQPKHLAGCLDIEASSKAARHVRFCDAFNIPLLTLVDVPGFLPGVKQEHGGIIKHGAKLLYAFSEASVPKVTLVTRKAYGGAYDVMSSKHIGADFNYAWPSAEIAVMGAEGAVKILHRKKLAELSEAEYQDTEEKLLDEYRESHQTPWKAAELGYIDAVIEPPKTRQILIESFEKLRNKLQSPSTKKHDNLPL